VFEPILIGALFVPALWFAIVVLPTRVKGEVLVASSVLACGLPCVFSADARSILRDGIEGCTIWVGDLGASKDCVLCLKPDHKVRTHRAFAARRRSEKFSGESTIRASDSCRYIIAAKRPTELSSTFPSIETVMFQLKNERGFC